MVKCRVKTPCLAGPRLRMHHTKEGPDAHQAAETAYAWPEEIHPSVARPAKQTRHRTLNGPEVAPAAGPEPMRKMLCDKAPEVTTNTDPPCVWESIPPWNLPTRHRPSRGERIAGYKAPATPQSKTYPPRSPTVDHETAPSDEEDTQKVRSQLASGTLKNGPELRTEAEGLGQHRDRPSMVDDVRPCDEATATPAKPRQTAVKIPGGTQGNTHVTRDKAASTAFRPGPKGNVLVRAAPDQATIQPYPGTNTGPPWPSAPTRHPVKSNLGGTGPHRTRTPRDNVGASVEAKTPKKTPYGAAGNDPTHATRNKDAARSQTGRVPFGWGVRAAAKRNRKRRGADTPAKRVTSSRPSHRQDSAWGARGCNPRSADPNGPGGGLTKGGKGTRVNDPLGNRDEDHGMQGTATRVEVSQGSQTQSEDC